MLKDHFIIISGKKVSLLQKFSINNELAEQNSFNKINIELNLGEQIKVSLIDDDILLIMSHDSEIRIDIDIASIEKLLKTYKRENHVDRK